MATTHRMVTTRRMATTHCMATTCRMAACVAWRHASHGNNALHGDNALHGNNAARRHHCQQTCESPSMQSNTTTKMMPAQTSFFFLLNFCRIQCSGAPLGAPKYILFFLDADAHVGKAG